MIQIIEQTRDEKIEMYMAIDKLKLAEMLVECNSHIKNFIYTPDMVKEYLLQSYSAITNE